MPALYVEMMTPRLPTIHLNLHFHLKERTTQNILFSITYYLDLHKAKSFTIDVLFSNIKVLMFYDVQTTSLTFHGKA